MSWKSDIAKHVREIRFIFCQSSAQSAGARYYN